MSEPPTRSGAIGVAILGFLVGVVLNVVWFFVAFTLISTFKHTNIGFWYALMQLSTIGVALWCGSNALKTNNKFSAFFFGAAVGLLGVGTICEITFGNLSKG